MDLDGFFTQCSRGSDTKFKDFTSCITRILNQKKKKRIRIKKKTKSKCITPKEEPKRIKLACIGKKN